MLLLEEPNSKATRRGYGVIVWRLTVGSLEDRLGRLVDSRGRDCIEKHAVLGYDIPEPRRNILVCHNCLGHAVDVTDALLRWAVGVVFTLGHNDVLNAVSKQEVVKLVAADLTAEVREEGLGVAADSRDELDICLLNTGLLTVRD